MSLLSQNRDIQSLVAGHIENPQRLDLLEYVSALPYEERMALYERTDSSFLPSQLKGGDLKGGAGFFDMFSLQDAPAPPPDQVSAELSDAKLRMDSARETIAAAVLENSRAHEEFLNAEATSKQLQAERDRINDEINARTKQMKDLVMAELMSNQKIAQASNDLASATIRKSDEEKRLAIEKENERVRLAEEALRAKDAEVFEAKEKARINQLAAEDEAEAIRLKKCQEATAQKLLDIDEAQRVAQEAERKADEDIQAAQAATDQIRIASEAEKQRIISEDTIERVDVPTVIIDSVPIVTAPDCPPSETIVVSDCPPLTTGAIEPELQARIDALQAENSELVKESFEWDARYKEEEAEIAKLSAQKDVINADRNQLAKDSFEWDARYKEEESEIAKLKAEKEALQKERDQFAEWTYQWNDKYQDVLRSRPSTTDVPEQETTSLTNDETSLVRRRVRDIENQQRIRGGAREVVDVAFREMMNNLILERSQKLKEFIEALYASKLDEFQQLVNHVIGAGNADAARVQMLIDEFAGGATNESAWFPQVKLYAGYMKQSYDDFLSNAIVDMEKINGGDVQLEGGNANAMKELQTCIARIDGFAERRAAENVQNCLEVYKIRVNE